MKKIYLQPSVFIETLNLDSMILAGSAKAPAAPVDPGKTVDPEVIEGRRPNSVWDDEEEEENEE